METTQDMNDEDGIVECEHCTADVYADGRLTGHAFGCPLFAEAGLGPDGQPGAPDQVSTETIQVFDCRYDHHGYCQEHRLGEQVKYGACAQGLADALTDQQILEAFEAALEVEERAQEIERQELVRLSRRHCYRRFDEAPDTPGLVAVVDDREWLLWLDRVESADRDDSGEPVDWFAIDRGED